MRIIPAPVVSTRAAPPIPSSLLEGVRDLDARFPRAHLRRVPVIRVPELDAKADPGGATRVWVALETMQVTGSFKVRGALVALDALAARGTKHVVAASAGNHGAGVAYAASVLGLPATIVMPRIVPEAKRARVAAYGAEIVLAPSDHYDDAEALARELAAKNGSAFLSPYDDEQVVAGNGASLGFEIVRAMGGVPELVLTPFGGGGLATGLAWALADESGEAPEQWRPVWGVQSEASPAMAMSLERGAAVERLTTDTPTLAEGLEGGVSAAAFERARAVVAGVIVVDEAAIARAMAHAHREMGLVLEGSAAVALAPLLEGLPAGIRGRATGGVDLVAVLTGRNVDRARLERVIPGASGAPNAPPASLAGE